jgi:hypothetical protein
MTKDSLSRACALLREVRANLDGRYDVDVLPGGTRRESLPGRGLDLMRLDDAPFR